MVEELERIYKMLTSADKVGWGSIDGVSLEDARKDSDLAKAGELKGLKLNLVEGEILVFPAVDKVRVYPRSINGGKPIIYVSCVRGATRVDHLPVGALRRKPASKYEKYDEEVAKLAADVNPLGAVLLDNAACFNDLDRVVKLCEAQFVKVIKKVEIHLQSFDKDGKPKDGEFYIQSAWTLAKLTEKELAEFRKALK